LIPVIGILVVVIAGKYGGKVNHYIGRIWELKKAWPEGFRNPD
jgi:hypothetical protein